MPEPTVIARSAEKAQLWRALPENLQPILG